MGRQGPSSYYEGGHVPISNTEGEIVRCLGVDLPCDSSVHGYSGMIPPGSFVLLAFGFLSAVVCWGVQVSVVGW